MENQQVVDDFSEKCYSKKVDEVALSFLQINQSNEYNIETDKLEIIDCKKQCWSDCMRFLNDNLYLKLGFSSKLNCLSSDVLKVADNNTNNFLIPEYYDDNISNLDDSASRSISQLPKRSSSPNVSHLQESSSYVNWNKTDSIGYCSLRSDDNDMNSFQNEDPICEENFTCQSKSSSHLRSLANSEDNNDVCHDFNNNNINSNLKSNDIFPDKSQITVNKINNLKDLNNSISKNIIQNRNELGENFSESLQNKLNKIFNANSKLKNLNTNQNEPINKNIIEKDDDDDDDDCLIEENGSLLVISLLSSDEDKQPERKVNEKQEEGKKKGNKRGKRGKRNKNTNVNCDARNPSQKLDCNNNFDNRSCKSNNIKDLKVNALKETPQDCETFTKYLETQLNKNLNVCSTFRFDFGNVNSNNNLRTEYNYNPPNFAANPFIPSINNINNTNNSNNNINNNNNNNNKKKPPLTKRQLKRARYRLRKKEREKQMVLTPIQSSKSEIAASQKRRKIDENNNFEPKTSQTYIINTKNESKRKFAKPIKFTPGEILLPKLNTESEVLSDTALKQTNLKQMTFENTTQLEYDKMLSSLGGKMILKMGYKAGAGLGKFQQGIKQPIIPQIRDSRETLGFSCRTADLGTMKMKKINSTGLAKSNLTNEIIKRNRKTNNGIHNSIHFDYGIQKNFNFGMKSNATFIKPTNSLEGIKTNKTFIKSTECKKSNNLGDKSKEIKTPETFIKSGECKGNNNLGNTPTKIKPKEIATESQINTNINKSKGIKSNASVVKFTEYKINTRDIKTISNNNYESNKEDRFPDNNEIIFCNEKSKKDFEYNRKFPNIIVEFDNTDQKMEVAPSINITSDTLTNSENGLKLVLLSSSGTLDSNQLEELKKNLKRIVFKAISHSNLCLQFEGVTIYDNKLQLNCSNKITYDWLKNFIIKSKPGELLPRVHIIINTLIQLPIIYKVKVTIPGESLLTNQYLQLIKNQNPELKTNEWITLKKNECKDGMEMIFNIKEESFKILKEKYNMKPYFGIDRIQFILC